MKTIGVIGLGSIGMRHGRNLTAMGHQVIGFDPINIGDGYPTIWPPPPGGLDRMDAVLICSPTDQHVSDLIPIGDHVPVFMEKPIGATKADFEYLSISSLDRDQIKMVGYNLRFHGCVKKAKEWLDSGNIGEPLWANFTLGQHSIKPPYLRDGVILNWSHEIDLALYLLGPANMQSVQSLTKLRDGKDIMTDINLVHKEAGCHTHIHLDYITDPEQRYFSIFGSEGHLFVNVADRVCNVLSLNGPESYSFKDAWNDNYIEEMQAFLDRIDGKETIGCSGAEGLRVLEICLEVRKQAGL